VSEAAEPENTAWVAGRPTGDRGDSAADADSPEAERHTDAGEAAEYRLADPEPPAASPDTPDIPQQETDGAESTFLASTDEGERPVPEKFPDPPPQVSHVWSRWVEWKEPIIGASMGVAIATLIVFAGGYVATLTFLVALAYGAYCIITSLEIPVRVTPEQAIQEFFAAAGHRLPNFRRMYGLLTDDGRRSTAYSDCAQFRAYWRERIGRFSGSPVWLVPLEFRVEGFRYRYNADKTMATVRCVVKIGPRGRPESAKPAAEFEVRTLVVKGPDGQWYVNDGTLPE
jgi:hypothetical protein